MLHDYGGIKQHNEEWMGWCCERTLTSSSSVVVGPSPFLLLSRKCWINHLYITHSQPGLDSLKEKKKAGRERGQRLFLINLHKRKENKTQGLICNQQRLPRDTYSPGWSNNSKLKIRRENKGMTTHVAISTLWHGDEQTARREKRRTTRRGRGVKKRVLSLAHAQRCVCARRRKQQLRYRFRSRKTFRGTLTSGLTSGATTALSVLLLFPSWLCCLSTTFVQTAKFNRVLCW